MNKIIDNINDIETIVGKQDTLTSGTTIKTINGTSILGSGNIDIVIPLNDTLTSTSTTEALTANQGKVLKDLVDTKQDTLVSGTNIATINNQSLLIGGNLSLGEMPIGSSVQVSTNYKNTNSNFVKHTTNLSALWKDYPNIEGKGAPTLATDAVLTSMPNISMVLFHPVKGKLGIESASYNSSTRTTQVTLINASANTATNVNCVIPNGHTTLNNPSFAKTYAYNDMYNKIVIDQTRIIMFGFTSTPSWNLYIFSTSGTYLQTITGISVADGITTNGSGLISIGIQVYRWDGSSYQLIFTASLPNAYMLRLGLSENKVYVTYTYNYSLYIATYTYNGTNISASAVSTLQVLSGSNSASEKISCAGIVATDELVMIPYYIGTNTSLSVAIFSIKGNTYTSATSYAYTLGFITDTLCVEQDSANTYRITRYDNDSAQFITTSSISFDSKLGMAIKEYKYFAVGSATASQRKNYYPASLIPAFSANATLTRIN